MLKELTEFNRTHIVPKYRYPLKVQNKKRFTRGELEMLSDNLTLEMARGIVDEAEFS